MLCDRGQIVAFSIAKINVCSQLRFDGKNPDICVVRIIGGLLLHQQADSHIFGNQIDYVFNPVAGIRDTGSKACFLTGPDTERIKKSSFVQQKELFFF